MNEDLLTHPSDRRASRFSERICWAIRDHAPDRALLNLRPDKSCSADRSEGPLLPSSEKGEARLKTWRSPGALVARNRGDR